jgi:hypothetical protein
MKNCQLHYEIDFNKLKLDIGEKYFFMKNLPIYNKIK